MLMPCERWRSLSYRIAPASAHESPPTSSGHADHAAESQCESGRLGDGRGGRFAEVRAKRRVQEHSLWQSEGDGAGVRQIHLTGLDVRVNVIADVEHVSNLHQFRIAD